MTKPKLPPATDWRARDITDWNVSTFSQFIIDRTQEIYGVPYAPGGGGSKSQRWLREKGMLKQAQGTYGNAVLRAFIEICWREYRTNKPEQFPYPTFAFMISYQDRYFSQAQSDVARAKRSSGAAEIAEVDTEKLAEWF
ncbi:hypothetical protein [Peribacillus huizhouensis]|uniref:Uncharacterized protein n=1 Tax=Peribacillus huizhouensis TaxID=1501239 RepID=A0ABR6CRC4_9BACI|nr:hypothetical protein [Peribacillus huizhouensis]MBA9027580.1 hypothetical protein [Peribacillus huizhouensis]